MSLEALVQDLGRLSGDPHAFVLWAFPWGEPGTELERFDGPESWQVDILVGIRDGLLTIDEAIQLAVASGHGVGKSALVAWIILWALSTFEDTRGVVTANTEAQLRTKTWAELGKWHRLFIGSELFKLTATALYERDHERTWRIDMIPWSENNTEAFAGLHNQGKRVLLIMDEASAIPDKIHETAEGALTDANTQIIWIMCGNPTRNTGRFREAFPGGKHAKAWRTWRVDSRTVRFTNSKQFASWIDIYGEDSDFVRIRVKGTFPRQGLMEFISYEAVEAAAKREVLPEPYEPLIMGVDVARFGDDESVIYFRKGRDARTIPLMSFRGLNNVQLAGRVIEAFNDHRASAVFIDGGGNGGGVVDICRESNINVFEVQFGSSPDGFSYGREDRGEKYMNKRSEIWGMMRSWLRGGAIPDDTALRAQLVGPQYDHNLKNEIKLEPKKDMKKRGLESPDRGDALALTFAMPIAAMRDPDLHQGPRITPLIHHEYNPYSAQAMGYAQ